MGCIGVVAGTQGPQLVWCHGGVVIWPRLTDTTQRKCPEQTVDGAGAISSDGEELTVDNPPPLAAVCPWTRQLWRRWWLILYYRCEKLTRCHPETGQTSALAGGNPSSAGASSDAEVTLGSHQRSWRKMLPKISNGWSLLRVEASSRGGGCSLKWISIPTNLSSVPHHPGYCGPALYFPLIDRLGDEV